MLRTVVLILKFTDNLFDGILDGDHAGDAAIFVDHHCHMLTGTLHLMEQVVHRLGFRYQHRLANDGLHITFHSGRVEGRGAYRILQIGHTNQIVHVLSDHRNAGESGAGEQFQSRSKRGIPLHANHVGTRHHDFAGQSIRQSEHIAEHLGDFRIEIVGFHQAINRSLALFKLNLLQLLVIGQAGILGTTTRAFD